MSIQELPLPAIKLWKVAIQNGLTTAMLGFQRLIVKTKRSQGCKTLPWYLCCFGDRIWSPAWQDLCYKISEMWAIIIVSIIPINQMFFQCKSLKWHEPNEIHLEAITLRQSAFHQGNQLPRQSPGSQAAAAGPREDRRWKFLGGAAGSSAGRTAGPGRTEEGRGTASQVQREGPRENSWEMLERGDRMRLGSLKGESVVRCISCVRCVSVVWDVWAA